MAAIATIASLDGKAWTSPILLEDEKSNYGIQMAQLGDTLYGVITHEDGSLACAKATGYGQFNDFKSMPAKFKSQGRVAVAASDERLFVAYRGTNDGVYLVWTDDSENWTDAGRIGSKYATTQVSPALTWQDDEFVITGVGADKYIYWTTIDADGKRKGSWKKIDGTGTQSALASVMYEGGVVLFHTAYNNKAFFYQYFYDGEWSELVKVEAPRIASGVSVVSFKGGLVLTYRGTNKNIEFRGFNGRYWSDEDWVKGGVYMKYQTGLAVVKGTFLLLSYGVDERPTRRTNTGYKMPTSMMLNEKGAMVSEKEIDDEWDVKWKNSERDNKSMIKKFFCCM